MKTKVIQLIGSLEMGGAETIVKDYALHIDKEQFQCIVICLSSSKDTPYEKLLRDCGIKVIFLDDERKFKNARTPLTKTINLLNRFYLLKKYIEKEKPDILHTHQAVNKYIFPINSKKLNTKLFHTYHTEIGRYIKNYKDYKFTTNYCIHKKDMIPIALHEKMRLDSNLIFKTDKTVIINNGIDIEKFKKPKKNRKTILEEIGVRDDEFVVGHIGRFEGVKNHKFIIKVFNEVQKKRHNSHLVLVGDGVMMDSIKDLVKDYGLQEKVSFIGKRQDVPELLNAFDTFIFPSFKEGFPISLIEAQASGVRCVVSNTITKSAFLSENTVSIDLDDCPELWSDRILDFNYKGTSYGKLEDFDIRSSMRTLESLYLGNNYEKK
ncbi:glycosyltransferase [Bacillus sp. ISL-55]|uniref:glycosyltransferase n=1 Tax=Bacillus sp. ISL-55 TaxID=2819134 RepID=UPI001BED1BB4|nr:glycosyltransferase [Bacillus sp. ISL-55]MBT2694469.1 glycosyltransferase [Bacillus sp. ISL-55]